MFWENSINLDENRLVIKKEKKKKNTQRIQEIAKDKERNRNIKASIIKKRCKT